MRDKMTGEWKGLVVPIELINSGGVQLFSEVYETPGSGLILESKSDSFVIFWSKGDVVLANTRGIFATKSFMIL